MSSIPSSESCFNANKMNDFHQQYLFYQTGVDYSPRSVFANDSRDSYFDRNTYVSKQSSNHKLDYRMTNHQTYYQGSDDEFRFAAPLPRRGDQRQSWMTGGPHMNVSTSRTSVYNAQHDHEIEQSTWQHKAPISVYDNRCDCCCRNEACIGNVGYFPLIDDSAEVDAAYPRYHQPTLHQRWTPGEDLLVYSDIPVATPSLSSDTVCSTNHSESPTQRPRPFLHAQETQSELTRNIKRPQLKTAKSDSVLNTSSASGPWTQAESEELLQMYNTYRKEFPDLPVRWTEIGRSLTQMRTGSQCQARYSEALDPEVLRGRWTKELDEQLVRLAKEHENSWTRVSAELKGKTQRQCRSRWVALQRRQGRGQGPDCLKMPRF